MESCQITTSKIWSSIKENDDFNEIKTIYLHFYDINSTRIFSIFFCQKMHFMRNFMI